MSAYFITGTGTDIGKTFILKSWISALKFKNKSIAALKPIISGWQTTNLKDNDTSQILEALDLDFTEDNINAISPWRFTLPLSPDLASTQENSNQIEFNTLVNFCKLAINKAKAINQTLLIEGAGGAFVPLNADYLIADWISALEIPLILVSGNYLGAISHTLSTVYALESRGIKVSQIFLNENKPNQIKSEWIQQSLQRFLSCPIKIIRYNSKDPSVFPNFD